MHELIESRRHHRFAEPRYDAVVADPGRLGRGTPRRRNPSRRTGLLEHERDSVLVYPVEQSLVWGIERILYDADLTRRASAKKGHAKLEERFGWNNVAEQIEQLMGVPPAR